MKTLLSIMLFFLVGLPVEAATYHNSELGFQVDYDEAIWKVSDKRAGAKAEKADVDKKMGEQTVVAFERLKADDKYHARFSVVTESVKAFQKHANQDPLVESYSRAVAFLESQRFDILTKDKKKLPKVAENGFEITATQRDFGLTFRQFGFIRGDKSYLLTAAHRDSKYEAQKKESAPFFDSFTFSHSKN